MTAKLKILLQWTIENCLGVNPSKTENQRQILGVSIR